jgi:SAM-dependent methyltransferase
VAHDPAGYGDAFADVYDDWYADFFDTPGAVEALALWGGSGPVLELGVGTGRLALPLAERGPLVIGIDASGAMLDKLRNKRSVDVVECVLADMAAFGAILRSDPRGLPDTGYTLVFCAFNTFFNLDSENLQSACLLESAAVLAPGGRLVIEAFVPTDPGSVPEQAFGSAQVESEREVITSTTHDAATQTIKGRHIEKLEDGHVHVRPWTVRYLSPAQLDHLALDAGFELEQRHEDWRKLPFTDRSQRHVSVYRRTADTRPDQAATRSAP